MKRIIYNLLAGFTLLLASCTPTNLTYLQDIEGGTEYNLSRPVTLKAEPGDKMSIVVSSRSPQLAAMFNLPILGSNYSTTSEYASGTSRLTTYTIAQNGTIEFPVLGPVSVQGLTREEIQNKISGEIISRDLLKDPIVTVNFIDQTYSVMGEVKTPGRYSLDHDYMTLLDAIGRAGDLTIYGKRENVLVTRVENGKQKNYRINLTNSNELYSSPAFYLKQNDLIYVEPNDRKAREATTSGNAFSSPSLWLSTASFLTTLGVLIFK